MCLVCDKSSFAGLTHRNCRTQYVPERFIHIFDYHQPEIKYIIATGKYKFIGEIFENISKIFTTHAIAQLPQLPEKSLITAIPLHKRRKNWRGFNQSEILAQSLANKYQVSYQVILHKTNNTQAQRILNKKQRKENIKNSFAALLPFPDVSLIILVDDVATTGSTLLEACKTIKAQAPHMTVWCVSLAKD